MLRAVVNRETQLTALAVLLMLAIPVVRFVAEDAHGVMLLCVVPIALLGIMHDLRVGLAAALFASVIYELWAVSSGRVTGVEQVDVPLTFFVLGLVSGGLARGALGDFDLRRAARRADLRHSIEKGELTVYYQPIVRAGDGTVTGVEALVRWQHPTRGLVSPAEFVPLAETDPATINALTEAVIDIAVADFAALRAGREEQLRMNINLAAGNLRRPAVLAHLRRRLAEHSLPLEAIQVEITESDLIDDHSHAAELLAALRADGASVALDDFGTGYSSLMELGALPVNALKIDRVLRGSGEHVPEGMVGPVIAMAHQLGLTVIAEQVESTESRDELVRLGADELQGFAISPPIAVGELERWLRERPWMRSEISPGFSIHRPRVCVIGDSNPTERNFDAYT